LNIDNAYYRQGQSFIYIFPCLGIFTESPGAWIVYCLHLTIFAYALGVLVVWHLLENLLPLIKIFNKTEAVISPKVSKHFYFLRFFSQYNSKILSHNKDEC